ncbi:MAG: lysylphosphatidylglycerol synthase transmembrane domain-containing protein [Bacteroidia bacterium]|nr:lysylphosphatidylglycerol synthase transmembrane domain-containing protein [Bacteroidia bacterium]
MNSPESHTDHPQQELISDLKPGRVIWPILIGVAVLAYALWQVVRENFNPITDITWTTQVFLWIGLGFFCMMLRDIGYIWRMRLLTDKKLGWRAAFEVTMLWEFSSAITPSVVGGSVVAIFMLARERITYGRSLAIVFLTIFLDELFYILILPAVLLVIGAGDLFSTLNGVAGASFFESGLIASFWIAYGILVGYTVFLGFALFIWPQGAARLIRAIVKTRLFRRWQQAGFTMAEELLIASRELRSRDFMFWLKAGLATLFAWMGRYLVLNCVLAAFTMLTAYEHVVAFGRQALLFVVMLISPSPGSSGVAEVGFSELFKEFSPVIPIYLLAVIWRLISYYPYLFVGAFILPRWLQRVSRKKPHPVPHPDPSHPQP